MREFFKGWRRKAGVVMLVMACALMAVWIRSRFTIDCLWYRPEGAPCHSLTLSPHGIRWVRYDAGLSFGGRSDHWETIVGGGDVSDLVFTHWNYELVWDWQQSGFHFARLASWHSGISEASGRRLTPHMIGVWIIPYWSATVPLTLLSAYLLLWKPRKAK